MEQKKPEDKNESSIQTNPEAQAKPDPRAQLIETLKQVQNTLENDLGYNPGFDYTKLLEIPPIATKMVFLVREDLEMSAGKIGAQIGHAACLAMKSAMDKQDEESKKIFDVWYNCGQAKIVLEVKSQEELFSLFKEAKAGGLNVSIIADLGRTEIAPGTFTVAAIGPAKSEDIDKYTKKLKPFGHGKKSVKKDEKKEEKKEDKPDVQGEKIKEAKKEKKKEKNLEKKDQKKEEENNKDENKAEVKADVSEK